MEHTPICSDELQTKIYLITGIIMTLVLITLLVIRFTNSKQEESDITKLVTSILGGGILVMFLGPALLLLVIAAGIMFGIPYMLVKALILLILHLSGRPVEIKSLWNFKGKCG